MLRSFTHPFGTPLGRRGKGLFLSVFLTAVCALGASTAYAGPPSLLQVSAGGEHTCFVRASGALFCFGKNWSGQTSDTPLGLGAVTQVSAGGTATCVRRQSDGTAACWGTFLGVRESAPVGLGSVLQVSAGETNACAIKTDSTVECWGNDSHGQSTVPVDLGTVTQLSAGGTATCAVKASDSSVVCWGDGPGGPSGVPKDLPAVKQISAGLDHSCAVTTTDQLICWGSNAYAQQLPPSDLGTVLGVSAGYAATCAITADRLVRCWGVGSTGSLAVPATVGAVTQISSGGGHMCAVKVNSGLVCWGVNAAGQATVPGSGALVDFGSAAGLDFGDLQGGQKSVVLRIPVLSRSLDELQADLRVSAVDVTDDGGGAFSIVSQNCTATPAPNGGYCVVRVRFRPQIWVRGDVNGSLTITDSSVAGTHVIPLTGAALAPQSFLVNDLGWTPPGHPYIASLSWDASDACKVTVTIVQPVKKVITIRKGRKKVRKTVTQNKPLTLFANRPYAAGLAAYGWDGQINHKLLARGNWAVTLTATSIRGKATTVEYLRIP